MRLSGILERGVCGLQRSQLPRVLQGIMAINIHTPSTPRHLKITQTMVEDFLIDPVMGARVILGVHFDAFQAAALRIAWWVPNVIDESGFGTGKSFRYWVCAQLRALLIEGQACCVLYQTFEAGKEIFWQNYSSQWAANKIFRTQLGKLDLEGEKDGKGNTRGPACYTQNFKNGSRILMPAPNWLQDATGQAGKTFSWAFIDEWTKIETMGKKTGTGVTLNNSGQVTGGINQQILGRMRKSSYNQYHMLWANHMIFSATAESQNHPSQARVNQFQKEIKAGNPNYAMISFSFKDASNLPSATGKPFKDQIIDWNTISNMKKQFTKSHFLRECLGVRVRESSSWYSEEAINRCLQQGITNGLEPEIARTFRSGSGIGDGISVMHFLGVDPAPAQGKKSDDGALAILRSTPKHKPGESEQLSMHPADWRCDFIWAYRLRGADVRQWSGFIHQKHRHFGLTGICMDSQGGGQYIHLELNKSRQLIIDIETEVTPITSLEDINVPNGQTILTLYRRRDPGLQHMWPHLAGDDNLYEMMHIVFQEAVEYGMVNFPRPFNERPREETESWPEEKKWALKNLDAGRDQLTGIQVATREDGTYALTGHSAKQFSATGKKDIAYSMIYAYVRFLVWLRMGALDFGEGGSGAGEGYSTF